MFKEVIELLLDQKGKAGKLFICAALGTGFFLIGQASVWSGFGPDKKLISNKLVNFFSLTNYR